MSLDLGYVVIGGRRFPIRSVRLKESKVVFVVEMAGPLPPLSGRITGFGEDGRGLWAGSVVTFPAIPADATVEFEYGLRTVVLEHSVPESVQVPGLGLVEFGGDET